MIARTGLVWAHVAVLLLVSGATAQAQDASKRWLRQVDDPKRVGLQMLRENDLIQAKELLERAELADPTDPQIRDALAETYYRIGDDLLNRHEAVEAGYYFERAQTKSPNSAAAFLGMGRAKMIEGDLDRAVIALERAEQLGSAEARGWVVRARVARADRYVSTGQLPAAQVDVQEALRRAPDDMEALLVLGRLRLGQGNPAAAIDPLKRVAGSTEFHSTAVLLLAMAYEAEKRWADAIRAATDAADTPAQITTANEIRARSYYNWALLAYDQRDWPVAEQRFMTAAGFREGWDDPLFGAGLARLRQNNSGGAHELLLPLYERRPDYPGIRPALAESEHAIGRSWIAAGRYDEAAKILRHAFDVDPNQPAIMLSFAEAEEGRQRFPQALEAYLVALRAGADPIASHRGAMRMLHDHLQKPLEALPHAEEVLRGAAGDQDARRRIIAITREQGLAANTQGDDELAIRLLRRHRDFVQDDKLVNFALAQSFSRVLQYADAWKLLKPLYEADPGNIANRQLAFVVRVGLGDESMLTRRWRAAREHYGAALEIDGQAHEVRFRYGNAILSLREYPEATTALRAVWNAAPALRLRVARPLAQALTGWSLQELDRSAVVAETLASEAISRDPIYANAYLARSRALERQAKIDDAIVDGETYFGQRPDDLDGEAWLVALLRRGLEEAYQAKRLTVAEQRARRLLELRDKDDRATYLLARSLYDQQRWAESVPFFERAAAVGRHRAEAYVWLARGYRRAGQAERAARYYMAARRLDDMAATVTEQVETFEAAATVAENDRRYEDVAKFYNYAFLLKPNDAAIAYAYGRALMRNGKPGDAVPHLRKAVSQWPDRRDAALDYAAALTAVAKPIEATKVLAPWEQPDRKGYAEVRRMVGWAFLQATLAEWKDGQLTAAAEHGQAAAERLDPEPEPWYALGRIRYEAALYDSAKVALERALAVGGNYKDTKVLLADLHVRRGDAALADAELDHARMEYDTAVKYNPSNLDGHYGLLLVAEAAGRPEEMLKIAARIAQLKTGYRDVRAKVVVANRMLGDLAFAGKDYGKAVSHYTRMIELDPNSAEAYYGIGAVRVAQGRAGEAIDPLERARKTLGLDYRDLRKLLAESYKLEAKRLIEANKLKDALSVIDKSLAADSDQPEILVWKGSLHEQQQDFDDAAKAYYQALRSPNLDPKLRDVLNQLLNALPQFQQAPAR